MVCEYFLSGVLITFQLIFDLFFLSKSLLGTMSMVDKKDVFAAYFIKNIKNKMVTEKRHVAIFDTLVVNKPLPTT